MMNKYRNRYDDTYYYEPVSEKTYKFVMEGDSMQWCRYGGKEGQMQIDTNDLGMFDPSGGPYVAVGDKVFGVSADKSIDIVKCIWVNDENVMIEVE